MWSERMRDPHGFGDEKAWKYVGRFLSSFAGIDAAIDGIIENMFNLNPVSFMFLLPNLDFQKKITLVKLGFAYQHKNYGKLLGEIGELQKTRNILAHSQFSHVRAYKRYKAGIEFSYIDKFGKMPNLNPEIIEEQKRDHKRKQKAHKKRGRKQDNLTKSKIETLRDEIWRRPDEQTITYAQFDKYDAQAKKLMLDLVSIEVEPINDGIPFVRNISEIIASSDNVLLFPK
jgi:hypothetical protein